MANKKIEAINALGKNVYCVLSGDLSFEKQLNEVFSFEKGAGYSVEMSNSQIVIKDYFHGDTVACFEIVSITDTDMEVDLKWTKNG